MSSLVMSNVYVNSSSFMVVLGPDLESLISLILFISGCFILLIQLLYLGTVAIFLISTS